MTASARVLELVRSALDVPMDEPVEPSSTLRDDLGADSIDVVEVVMAVEEDFAIEIDGDDSEAFVTVADVIACVERHVGGGDCA